jgi:hypothetical protein
VTYRLLDSRLLRQRLETFLNFPRGGLEVAAARRALAGDPHSQPLAASLPPRLAESWGIIPAVIQRDGQYPRCCSEKRYCGFSPQPAPVPDAVAIHCS